MQTMSLPDANSTIYEDPSGLIRLPPDSVHVEDPEEEIFLLYTNLSTRPPQDSSSSSFIGLGSVDSKQDTLSVRFVLPPSPIRRHEFTPSDLEGTDAHVSRRHDKRANRSLKPKSDDERVLEIELLQDKTALRSKRGDTGSVLWRVSVALGQAILNDLCPNSPNSIFNPEKLKKCNVLELGAGTGLLCLLLAPWVQHYTVTDLDYLLPLIQKNISVNLPAIRETLQPTRRASSKVSRRPNRSGARDNLSANEDSGSGGVNVEPLDWLELQRASPRTRGTCFRLARGNPADLIIVSDCVYNPALLPALLATIEHYAVPGLTRVLVAVELRSADVMREFLELWAGSGGWEVWRIGSGDNRDEERDGNGWLGVDFAVWIGWKKMDDDCGGGDGV